MQIRFLSFAVFALRILPKNFISFSNLRLSLIIFFVMKTVSTVTTFHRADISLNEGAAHVARYFRFGPHGHFHSLGSYILVATFLWRRSYNVEKLTFFFLKVAFHFRFE